MPDGMCATYFDQHSCNLGPLGQSLGPARDSLATPDRATKDCPAKAGELWL